MKGRPRKVTDAEVRRIRDWKPLKQLIRETGISCRHAYKIRAGYQHKTPSP